MYEATKPGPEKGFESVDTIRIKNILLLIPEDHIEIRGLVVYIQLDQGEEKVLDLNVYSTDRAEVAITDIFNIIVNYIIFRLDINDQTKNTIEQELIEYGLEILPKDSHDKWRSLVRP